MATSGVPTSAHGRCATLRACCGVGRGGRGAEWVTEQPHGEASPARRPVPAQCPLTSSAVLQMASNPTCETEWRRGRHSWVRGLGVAFERTAPSRQQQQTKGARR